MIKEIVKIPNQILTIKAPSAVVNEELKTLVADLLDTLKASTHPKGAGLAAPQIGVSKRVCIVTRFTPDPTNPDNELETHFILINPEILSHSEVTSINWEGCLSIPNTYGRVERYKRLKVKAYDINGNDFTIKAEGFFARVIQHEIDHLDGILFTSKIVGRTYTEKELDEMQEEKK